MTVRSPGIVVCVFTQDCHKRWLCHLGESRFLFDWMQYVQTQWFEPLLRCEPFRPIFDMVDRLPRGYIQKQIDFIVISVDQIPSANAIIYFLYFSLETLFSAVEADVCVPTPRKIVHKPNETKPRFSRFRVIRRAQRAADDLKANGCERLLAAVNWLVFRQFDGGSPLLRPALSSLPEPLKSDILQEYDRNAVHFGSMVSDGIADGSLRPVDAQIGAHVIAAVINGSTELDQWIFGEGEAVGNQSYVLALVSGLTGPLLPH